MIVRRNGEGSPAETDYEIFTSTTRTMYFTWVTQHQPNVASHAHVKAHAALYNKPLSVHRYPRSRRIVVNYGTKILEGFVWGF